MAVALGDPKAAAILLSGISTLFGSTFLFAYRGSDSTLFLLETLDYRFYRLMKIRFVCFKATGLILQDHAVAGGAYQLEYSIYLDLQSLRISRLAYYGHEHRKIICIRLVHGSLEHSPVQVLVDKLQRQPLLLKLIQDVIHNGQDLVFGSIQFAIAGVLKRVIEQQLGFMRYQLLLKIIFIFEVKIEGAFGNACFSGNVLYRSLDDPLGGIQVERRIHQAGLLL